MRLRVGGIPSNFLPIVWGLNERRGVVHWSNNTHAETDTSGANERRFGLAVNGSPVKVDILVRGHRNEHWIRRDEIFSPGEGCKVIMNTSEQRDAARCSILQVDDSNIAFVGLFRTY